MTERELENLKHFDGPPPRAEAKRAAIDSALAAFDATADTQKEFEPAAQATAVPARPMRTVNRSRSYPMNLATRHNMAIAASLAALVIAAPLAFRTFEQEQALRDIAAKPDAVATPPKIATAEPSTGHKKKAAPADAVAVAAPHDNKVAGKVASEVPAAEPAKPESPTSAVSAVAPPAELDEAARGSAVDTLKSAEPAPEPAPPPPADVQASTMAASPESRAYNGPVAPYSLGLTPAPMPATQGGLAGVSPGAYSFDGAPADQPVAGPAYKDHDIFNAPEVNPVKQVAAEPVSTFSFDVDTASYSFMRRALNEGHLPPKESVRVEEMINYFPYSYPAPDSADVPFKPTVTMMPCPWKPTDKLVHIGIKGYDLKHAERPRANLVFLLDISGSMEPEDRLPLVKNALRLLLDQLQPDDTVGIVTYASGSGIALEPTKISDKAKILAAIDKLEAGGSTDGADGINDAYRLAEANFDKKAVNRIILATDGDFNVGITDRDQLKSYIERKRESGVFLSILSVGEGNYNDALMQALAQNGNGTANYIDTLNEARKVLVDEASSSLFTIAKDVKAQVEWNPARVSEYRLIGYETRALKREDFNNDAVDAGDIGSGHTVTAIYEVTPVGAPRLVDDLRYEKSTSARGDSATRPAPQPSTPDNAEIGFLKLRYKKPASDKSELISLPITDALQKPAIGDAPADVRFSVAVAAFGDLVRGAPYVSNYSFDDVLALGQSARGDDPYGYRAEFLNLVRLAKSARP